MELHFAFLFLNFTFVDIIVDREPNLGLDTCLVVYHLYYYGINQVISYWPSYSRNWANTKPLDLMTSFIYINYLILYVVLSKTNVCEKWLNLIQRTWDNNCWSHRSQRGIVDKTLAFNQWVPYPIPCCISLPDEALSCASVCETFQTRSTISWAFRCSPQKKNPFPPITSLDKKNTPLPAHYCFRQKNTPLPARYFSRQKTHPFPPITALDRKNTPLPAHYCSRQKKHTPSRPLLLSTKKTLPAHYCSRHKSTHPFPPITGYCQGAATKGLLFTSGFQSIQ